jgi:hypothetical protein
MTVEINVLGALSVSAVPAVGININGKKKEKL